MRHRLTVIFVSVLAALVLAAPAAASGLTPGKAETLHQQVPVNIVLVGYENEVNSQRLLAQLANTYKPVVRYPRFYGLQGRDMGLRYALRYNVIRAGNTYERNFFRYLRSIGTPEERTDFQTAYNDQKRNNRFIPKTVLAIDAPSVSEWFDAHAGSLGVGAKGYTVYLVNWHGKPGFRYHVFRRTDRVDPDTGFNFGLRDSRAMIAWGGQGESRSWFYDLSAGPESWSNNWNVDDADVDGDSFADERMPPVWEYTAGGYKPRRMLSGDLGKVVRYIAVDMLFTTSPLYDPMVTAPGRNGAKVVDITLFEDDPGSNGRRWVRPGVSLAEFSSLEPYYRWKIALRDRAIDPGARHAFRVFAGLRTDPRACWHEFGDPFAELFCYFDANLDRYVPAYPKNDYVGEVFAFNTTDARMGDQAGLLGYADDNWVDGTQTQLFMFDTPDDRAFGFGFTDTLTHEFGHHVGLSHPHDGYDSASGVDFDATGKYQFAWTGDESDTVMQYLGVSGGFSKFDRDNMFRWETAGYINRANELLGRINTSGRAGEVRDAITRANGLADAARTHFHAWRYLDGVTAALASYDELRAAAVRIGVPIEKPGSRLMRVAPGTPFEHPVDPIRR
ncbi:MAG: hypothetical protein QOJ13_858 [Gaiellales bacterium]|nr:hypothetical protein [Gaiellales bacterium]